MARERFDSGEMMQYGYDPFSEKDIAAWLETEPTKDEPVTDYSDDPFEFGGQKREYQPGQ